MFPWIKDSDLIVVADVYDPFHLESLELGQDLDEDSREALITSYLSALNEQLRRADLILCASEKQRDLWLGHVGALGRINSQNYARDHSLRQLIEVVPFGVSDESPRQARHAIKGNIQGIGADDKVIIWGGGIYNWFDPLTLIHAISLLSTTHPEIRLVFLGMKHPNPNVPAMRMSTRTRELSDSLSLTNKFVFFNEEWVDYEDRINYLMDADVGVSTHFEHIETSFSFRTRLLDYIWASLPIVATDGDSFAPLIQSHGLGAVVPPENPQALASALEAILFSGEVHEIGARVHSFGANRKWSSTLAPLIRFCSAPSHSADYPFSESLNYTAALPSSIQHEFHDLQSRNAELELQASSLIATATDATAELTAVLNSRSWKITAWFRSLMQLLRRRTRKTSEI